MGYTCYSTNDRSHRTKIYASLSDDNIFTQNVLKNMHESMDPKSISVRECRDSETHPNTIPIIISLDVTGSMRKVPSNLVKNGLPTMMTKLIDNGVPDASVLFLSIGDHVTDHCPLQVGQFESGDLELDLWLTRTYLEGRGGANNGESYMLAWYFAAFHVKTDAYEKRNKKGFLFTIGDEPCLPSLPGRSIDEIMGNGCDVNYTSEELLNKSKEKFEVYHIHVLEGEKGHKSLPYWENLLGQNCIPVNNHNDIPDIISKIVLENSELVTKNNLTINSNPVNPNNSNNPFIL